jgi:predicted Ser/Thr protein kinase
MKKNYTIPFSEFSVVKDLDEGNSGRVCLGKWKGTLVTLKFCKNDYDVEKFLKEARIMMYELCHCLLC